MFHMCTTHCVPVSHSCVGAEAVDRCLEAAADLHHWTVKHHGGIRHGHLERDPPQDGVRAEPLGSRLP